MRRVSAAVVLMSLLMGATSGCGKEKAEVDPAEERCRGALGGDAVSWMDSIGAKDYRASRYDDLDIVGNTLKGMLRTWTGRENSGDLNYWRDVCDMSSDTTGKDVRFTWGESRYAFSETVKKEKEVLSRLTRRDTDPKSKPDYRSSRVNSDVLLTFLQQDSREVPFYRVYLRCAVPGARDSQIDGDPVAVGAIGETGSRLDGKNVFRHLLRSARLLAKRLDCQNKPQIPTKVPASMR
ncbi:hypothetical protein [Streptomyces sp. NPDC005438]|uniref:hypothetical protein n=1 Tax=Streptomyces sp. NPDC005438 TaxID=3156880 RepID=UPI0033B8B0F9